MGPVTAQRPEKLPRAFSLHVLAPRRRRWRSPPCLPIPDVFHHHGRRHPFRREHKKMPLGLRFHGRRRVRVRRCPPLPLPLPLPRGTSGLAALVEGFSPPVDQRKGSGRRWTGLGRKKLPLEEYVLSVAHIDGGGEELEGFRRRGKRSVNGGRLRAAGSFPDGDGDVSEGEGIVGVGHRRLLIIDNCHGLYFVAWAWMRVFREEDTLDTRDKEKANLIGLEG
ncbi:unnamed protein product, partial [Musa acuminata var. zebrina]